MLTGLFLCCVTCLYSIVIKMSKRNGVYEFEVATTILLSETFKFLYSLIQLNSSNPSESSSRTTSSNPSLIEGFSVWFAIPAIIYAASNNLVWVANSYLSPPQYQLLSNFKMPATVLLHRMVFKKTRHTMHWVGIFMLMIGSVADEMLACTADVHETKEEDDKGGGFSMIGLSIMLVISCMSAVAGIFSEFKLKQFKNRSIHFSNIQLYFFGVLVNGSLLFWRRGLYMFSPTHFFAGYNVHTVAAVIIHACMGILVSFIMKYADNIMKLFSGAAASGLSAVASYFLFHEVPSNALIYGTFVVLLGLFIYTRPEFEQQQKESRKRSNSKENAVV